MNTMKIINTILNSNTTNFIGLPFGSVILLLCLFNSELFFALLLLGLGAVGLCLVTTENSSETIFTVSGSSFGPSALPFPFGAMGTVLFVLVSEKVLTALHLIFGTVLPIAFGLIVKALGYLFARSTLGALLVSLFILSTQVSIAVVAGVMSSPFFYLAVTLITTSVLVSLFPSRLGLRVSITSVNYSGSSSSSVADSVKITEVATTNKTCTKRTKDAISAVLNDNGSFLLSASVDNGILTIVSKAKAKPKVDADDDTTTEEDSS
jgi:hypothetical protein